MICFKLTGLVIRVLMSNIEILVREWTHLHITKFIPIFYVQLQLRDNRTLFQLNLEKIHSYREKYKTISIKDHITTDKNFPNLGFSPTSRWGYRLVSTTKVGLYIVPSRRNPSPKIEKMCRTYYSTHKNQKVNWWKRS